MAVVVMRIRRFTNDPVLKAKNPRRFHDVPTVEHLSQRMIWHRLVVLPAQARGQKQLRVTTLQVFMCNAIVHILHHVLESMLIVMSFLILPIGNLQSCSAARPEAE